MLEQYQNALSWIDSQSDDLIKQLIEWSEVNSGSFNVAGIQKAAALAIEAFTPLGCDIEMHEDLSMKSVDDQGNEVSVPLGPLVKLTKRPKAPTQILFTGHLDTVFPKDSHFQKTKWLDNGHLNGPGVADMKGGILVILTALKALEMLPDCENIGWTVILNPDEEIGSHGSVPFLQEAAKKAHYGLVYEPSATPEGTLAGERKGSGNFSVVIKGISAHAGRAFHEGRNAICAMSDMIQALNNLNGNREGFTLNVGKVVGGGPLNVVPDLAVLAFNVRLAQPEDEAWLTESLAQIIQDINQKEGVSAELHGGVTRPPKPLIGKTKALFEEVKKAGELLGQKINWVATGGVCDGNNLAACGLPVVDTLGVRGGLIHSDQEFMIPESLAERAKLSLVLMTKLAKK